MAPFDPMKIAHMNPDAIVIARSRLRVATQTLNELNRCTNHDDFSDRWFVFITSWKSIYTVLEEGAKASPQCRQWFGAKKAERRKDPLLQYLFQARNDEEHGLAQSVQPSGGVQLYSIPDVGVPNRQMRIEIDPVTGRSKAVRNDGGPITLIQESPPGPSLQVVTGRGNVQYGPPIAHLGKMLDDISPAGVATVGLNYVGALISEAESIFAP